jgi:SAM-dependent methyltransferase
MRSLASRLARMMTSYRQAKLLADVAYDRWLADPARANDRSHLTRRWNFEAPLEQERYRRVLAMVERHRGAGDWGAVLEVGCSEGIFTTMLAPRARLVVATDVSSLACARATQRCVTTANVRVEPMDLARDPIAGKYDAIFAMGVLEFVHGRARLAAVARKLSDALNPCGIVAITICRLPAGLRHGWWTRWFPEGADCIVPMLSSGFGLRLIEQAPQAGITTSGAVVDHVVALFEKDPELTP